ncbi:putative transcription factor C2H2 family [Dioscorea sansibarensis]
MSRFSGPIFKSSPTLYLIHVNILLLPLACFSICFPSQQSLIGVPIRMKLQTYAGFSFLAAITVIYHAFSSREQFYPAMVYLSTSKICLVILLNMGLVLMCMVWQLVKRIFLGSLREAEVERLNEQAWREVMEILFAITIFRQDFSVTFLAMVTALLLIKALHWLAQKRVEYIETTPSVTTLSHIRIVSFMGFLLTLDCLFFYSSLKPLIQTWQASVALFFAFEYMILATTTVATFIKYIFYVSDMLMDGQWEKKAVYTFYLELVRDLLHLSMYIIFFFVIFVNYGVPLHLIRELYETFRNFRIRVADYIRYRKLTSNMNERFPDATPAEINASDATCIICREEMVTAKKLLCGHLFHVHCLRSWLERQHTCPTCRSLVVPPENGPAGVRRQHGTPHESHQPGSATPSTSTQGSAGDATTENTSQHQARLRAAAMAASLYEKSFVYPPRNTLLWSPGYPSVTTKAVGQTARLVGNSDEEKLLKAQMINCVELQIKLLQSQLQAIQQEADRLTTKAAEE